jgi:hypothetical protein
MRARLAAILLTGTAALALMGSAATSSATTTTTTTWTVTPGGTVTGSARFAVTDATTGSAFSCPDDIDGNYPFHRPGPNPYGYITGLSLGGCTGPLGLTFVLTANALPWAQNGTSYNPGTGVTTGTITGIHATLSGSSCSAVVDGTSPGADNGQVTDTYTNGTAKMNILTTGGNLHFYNVSGCLGLIRNGDAATFSASYTLSPAQTITSP